MNVPALRALLTAALAVQCVSWGGAPACADPGQELQAGITVYAADAHHREAQDQNIATSLVPAPTLDLVYRNHRFEITTEFIPPVGEIPLSKQAEGIQSVRAMYLDGAARYYSANRRFGIGLGEIVWNQRTTYKDGPSVLEYDASRGVGARYEALAALPAHGGPWEATVAVSPRVNAALSWTFVPATISIPPVYEQGAETDIAVGKRTIHRSGDFYIGARWINLSAKAGGGAFLDANWLVGLEFRYLWNVFATSRKR